MFLNDSFDYAIYVTEKLEKNFAELWEKYPEQILILFPHPYLKSFVLNGQKVSVDPSLLLAVARQESRFRRSAVSPVGAKGLMQLMPATAKRFGVSDPFAPDQNIAGGIAYLDFLLRSFGDDPIFAAAAYNAGPSRAERWMEAPRVRY